MKCYLKTLVTYGMIFMDTMGNVAGQSWNIRGIGNDGADLALHGTQPAKALAAASGEAGGWFLSGGVYYLTMAGVDWTRFRVLDPSYMQADYEARLALKKLDPIATLQTNSWAPTGAASIHLALIESTYPPFTASATLRIGTNTVGRICEVRCATLTVPSGHTLTSLTAWVYGSVPGSTTRWEMRLKHGSTVLATYRIPFSTTSPGWFAANYNGSMVGVDLADLRIEFEHTDGTGFTNIYAAHIQAEIIPPSRSSGDLLLEDGTVLLAEDGTTFELEG